MSDNLQKLLDDRLGEGRLDSEGCFMIDLDQARRKVARYGLDGPDKGLLRLAQCAVAAGATRLEIIIAADTLTLQALGSERLQSQADQLSEPLSIALWSCLHSGFESIEIASTSKTNILLPDGLQQGRRRNIQPGVTRFEFKRAVSKNFWTSMKMLIAGRSHDTAVLGDRLRYSPIPVTLDSRRIDLLPYSNSSKRVVDIFLTGGEATQIHEIGAAGAKNAVAQHTFRMHHYFQRPDSDWNTNIAFFRPAQAIQFGLMSSWRTIRDESVLAHLWIPKSGGATNLVLVKLGVVVGRVESPICGVASAAGLDLDASGLAVVGNSKLDRFLQYLTFALTKEWKNIDALKLPSSVQRRLATFRP